MVKVSKKKSMRVGRQKGGQKYDLGDSPKKKFSIGETAKKGWGAVKGFFGGPPKNKPTVNVSSPQKIPGPDVVRRKPSPYSNPNYFKKSEQVKSDPGLGLLKSTVPEPTSIPKIQGLAPTPPPQSAKPALVLSKPEIALKPKFNLQGVTTNSTGPGKISKGTPPPISPKPVLKFTGLPVGPSSSTNMAPRKGPPPPPRTNLVESGKSSESETSLPKSASNLANKIKQKGTLRKRPAKSSAFSNLSAKIAAGLAGSNPGPKLPATTQINAGVNAGVNATQKLVANANANAKNTTLLAKPNKLGNLSSFANLFAKTRPQTSSPIQKPIIVSSSEPVKQKTTIGNDISKGQIETEIKILQKRLNDSNFNTSQEQGYINFKKNQIEKKLKELNSSTPTVVGIPPPPPGGQLKLLTPPPPPPSGFDGLQKTSSSTPSSEVKPNLPFLEFIKARGQKNEIESTTPVSASTTPTPPPPPPLPTGGPPAPPPLPSSNTPSKSTGMADLFNKIKEGPSGLKKTTVSSEVEKPTQPGLNRSSIAEEAKKKAEKRQQGNTSVQNAVTKKKTEKEINNQRNKLSKLENELKNAKPVRIKTLTAEIETKKRSIAALEASMPKTSMPKTSLASALGSSSALLRAQEEQEAIKRIKVRTNNENSDFEKEYENATASREEMNSRPTEAPKQLEAPIPKVAPEQPEAPIQSVAPIKSVGPTLNLSKIEARRSKFVNENENENQNLGGGYRKTFKKISKQSQKKLKKILKNKSMKKLVNGGASQIPDEEIYEGFNGPNFNNNNRGNYGFSNNKTDEGHFGMTNNQLKNMNTDEKMIKIIKRIRDNIDTFGVHKERVLNIIDNNNRSEEEKNYILTLENYDFTEN